MIRIKPLLRGESRAIRVTLMDADTESAISTAGMTMKVRLGRNAAALGEIFEITSTPDEAQSELGQLSCVIPVAVIEGVSSSSCVIDVQIDTGAGEFTPVVLAVAPVIDAEEHRQNYYRKGAADAGTPVFIQGGAASDESIVLNISNDIDPTFDVGVLVKFDELPAGTLEYLESLQADITQKHAEVMAQ